MNGRQDWVSNPKYYDNDQDNIVAQELELNRLAYEQEYKENKLRLKERVCGVCGEEFDSKDERDLHQEECYLD